ncbi:MAG TPA: hypothetical protein VFN35_18115, partial [Ktedonobacteraceae bacterium]|nr:hypothetical protein [Ktedonobacteraceae bacterium]
MKKKLPLIVAALIILAALLVAIPFSPRILSAMKNRFREIKANALATPIPTTLVSSKGPWGPLISRDAPAFTNSESSPASQATDNSYDSIWRSNGTPAWLAYD